MNLAVSQSPPGPIDPARQRRGRVQALLIFLVCAAPVVLGTIAYFGSPPTGRTNYGRLLAPAPLKVAAQFVDGTTVTADSLSGPWWLVNVDSGECDEACARKLLLMRQMRLAQGKAQTRIERLWLVTDDHVPVAPEAVLAGVRVAHLAAGAALGTAFADEDPVKHLYLIDPLGNLMMSFPWPPEEKRMLRDIEKLLRVNSWQKG